MATPNDEREARQLALMTERLRLFRVGEISLGQVIADLEGLVNALEHAPDEWRDAFEDGWAVLETDYAVADDKGTAIPTASDYDIANALTELERLIAMRSEPV